MSTPLPEGPQGQSVGQVTALHLEPPDGQEPEVMTHVISFNSLSRAHENLWSRTRQATDMVNQAAAEARSADSDLEEADLAHGAAQAEHPDREAPRSRQWLFAGGALALDAVACYFAAEALGGSQPESLAWAGLFLALLAAAEIGLDHYRDSHRGLWRGIAFVLGGFIALLGLLRFSFLATVGTEGLVAAVTGAGLFTLATAGFVVIGYRALRAAESGPAWRARRRARAYARAADAAHRRLGRQIARRDRLVCAYLSRIRTRLIQTCTAGQLPLTERAVRTHLLGEERS